MAQAKQPESKQAPSPASNGTASGLLAAEVKQASSVAARVELPTVAGPFPVGNIGSVRVVERSYGERAVKYAQFESGTSRPTRIPLAAVAVLAEELD